MDVNQHYAALLGLGDEWTVTNVALDVPGKRVDVYVEYAQKSAICPVCGELAGLHDRLEERSWRHLDTMQFVTEIHARTPPCVVSEARRQGHRAAMGVKGFSVHAAFRGVRR